LLADPEAAGTAVVVTAGALNMVEVGTAASPETSRAETCMVSAEREQAEAASVRVRSTANRLRIFRELCIGPLSVMVLLRGFHQGYGTLRPVSRPAGGSICLGALWGAISVWINEHKSWVDFAKVEWPHEQVNGRP
jgi:hypothetical protein